ncbi:MAG: sulfatase-like hydrolase/transferase, partial [Candidatus Yanofskybacteria bacterium]|nr:sulfatase-like hydrolase/transferase [Candidatus Yanofskybacteria bacterium]
MKLFSAEKMNGGSFIERHSRKIGAGLVIGTIAGFFKFLGGQFGLFQKFNSLALWLGHSAISVVEAGSQPNVVVIMADDLDSGITAFLVNNGFMPNLKRYLIDEGTAFNESFVTNAVCCPARATYLTGQYSHNNGVLTNMLPKGGASLLKDESTLAVWLQAVGYRTSYIGKYLNAYGTSDMNHDGVVDAQ